MPTRRSAPVLAVVAAALAACGSSPVTTESVVTLDDVPVATSAPSSVAPTATTTVVSRAPGNLSIADAMLPDDTFAPPWEPTDRDPQYRGYGVGPNQSSCPEYEIVESMAGRDGGWVFWWVDGGNANHHVTRERYPGEGAELVAMAGATAERCPTVSWGEGGDLTTAPLDLGDEIAGFVFVTDPGRDVGYAAVTTWGDLISVLWVPMWTAADGQFPDLTPARFAAIAQRMRDQLLAAGPAAPDRPTTTAVAPPTTTLPGTRPATTAPTTVPDTTVPVAPSGTAALLLDADDLGADWELLEIREYSHQPADDEFVSVCPAARSIDDADALFEWGVDAELDDPDDPSLEARLGLIVGRAPDPATARAIVEQFATISECDLAGEFGDDADVSGGPVDVDGASAAAEVRVVIPSEVVSEVLLIAVDDVLIVVGIDGNGTDVVEQTYDIAERAVAKILGS